MNGPRGAELEAFQAFCDLAGFSPEAFEYLDNPDFALRVGSLAVELVAYHRDADSKDRRGSKRRMSEIAIYDAIDDAARRYGARHPHRLDVYFGLVHGTTGYLPKTAAADLLAWVEVTPRGTTNWDVPRSLRRVFSNADVDVTPAYQCESIWQPAVAELLDAKVAALQAVLTDKQVNLPRYRERYSTLWLVVYGARRPVIGLPSRRGWSGCGRVTSEIAATRFVSDFQRVYYLDEDGRSLTRLRIARLRCV